MPPVIYAFLDAVWDILLESSPFILLGFFIAGILKGFVSGDFVRRHLGGGGLKSIFKSALFGVPLPLCSCGVIPAAAGLRAQGASKGATTSFLIATPETGVNSISLSLALLDPIIAVVRPVSAFFTGIVAGFLVQRHVPDNAATVTGHTPCTCEACVSVEPDGNYLSDEMREQECACEQSGEDSGDIDKAASRSFAEKMRYGMSFAFGELLSDIALWFIVGILLAGVISVAVPDDFFVRYGGSGFGGILMMIIVGIPLNVCATTSTPIAAAMAMKGLSPGAVLVFLLIGPATNVTTITMVTKLLGRRTMFIYLTTIAVSAVLIGLAVNGLYSLLGLDLSGWVHMDVEEQHGIFEYVCAVVLMGLFARNLIMGGMHGHEHGHDHEHGHGH